MSETLSASVERVTFHDPVSGFAVLKTRIRGVRELVTIVGRLPAISPGEAIEASGEWKNDPVHGRQFQAGEIRALVPTTRSGIEKYLGSGAVRGVGPHLAKTLVQHFGDELFTVIEKQPNRLREVSGIGPKRVAMITSSWSEQRGVRDLMLFLQSHGIGTTRALKIYRQYGTGAISLIRENPYRLADEIRGIGFLSADKIALDLGLDKNSPSRARAGVVHVLQEAVSGGHCGLPRRDLVARSVRLLEITDTIVIEAVESEVAGGRLIADRVAGVDAVFLPRLHRAEIRVATDLRSLAGGRPPWPSIDAEKALAWLERIRALRLASTQREAVRLVLQSKVTVITGGPGVGKTTLVDSIITILSAKKMRITLCAPTGRAAKRLAESTGREARTIHRLLEVDPATGGFRRGRDNPLECDLLVVDETSMVDVLLMEALLRAVPPRAAVLFVGDADQLPSVGPGQVLADIIASDALPVIRLTEIFRQAAESRIIVNAHRVNRGLPLQIDDRGTDADFYFVRADDPLRALEKIVQIVSVRIPERFGLDPLRDVQVLAPMNKGTVGVRTLNDELKRALNPPGARPKLMRLGMTLSAGDKVMQTINNYQKDVFNGDLGVIASIDPEEGTLEVEFDGRLVPYESDELEDLTLAYATTIHKSQGSEYAAVVIPMSTQHYVMLQRNLLYTAITRGKRLVVLVGEARAIELAVRNHESRRRCSKLKEWLIAETLPQAPLELL
ncbi:MAG TPA: ATP-dependent RecD-like DNA helicase [Thermoanaerobaculia bacterium]|nr:ATP-dependent RecD-like DNA helicase [Thermoanaerobaculia bacterium]